MCAHVRDYVLHDSCSCSHPYWVNSNPSPPLCARVSDLEPRSVAWGPQEGLRGTVAPRIAIGIVPGGVRFQGEHSQLSAGSHKAPTPKAS